MGIDGRAVRVGDKALPLVFAQHVDPVVHHLTPLHVQFVVDARLEVVEDYDLGVGTEFGLLLDAHSDRRLDRCAAGYASDRRTDRYVVVLCNASDISRPKTTDFSLWV